MSAHRPVSPSQRLALVVLLAGTVLCEGGAIPLDADSSPPAPTAVAIAAASQATFEQAADARRRGDCAAPIKSLAPLAAKEDDVGRRARLLSGLYAHACERPDRAVKLLNSVESPDSPLEDWRLFTLADSAAATGDDALALSSLTRLLAHHPDSPLRPRALLRAAHLAWDTGQTDRTLHLIAMSRHEGLDGEAGEAMETLAWQLADKLDDDDARQEAARRLLSIYPLKAAELHVIEIFRLPDGELPWNEILSDQQLTQRAASLLDAGLPDNALTTLNNVAETHRDFEWRLLDARALIGAHRGAEALSVLQSAQPEDDGNRARQEWVLAHAAMDMAVIHRGRTNLDANGRKAMRRAAHEHLWKVVSFDTDRARTLKALQIIFADLADDNEFEQALTVLKQLKRLRSVDTTGASFLWQRGWQQELSRNYTGAIGYWAELEELYPETSYARAGTYWSARAYESLGEQQRARDFYARLAASDTTDFYRKQALPRLGGRDEKPSSSAAIPTDPWPTDARLTRAETLYRAGLNGLALSELDAVAGKAELAAAQALRAHIFASQGEIRKSIRALRDVFPALGRAQQARVPLDARRMYYPMAYHDTVIKYAHANGLPPDLIFAMIRQESAFDTHARSWAGARGLMQLMPATGREVAHRIGLRYSSSRLVDPDFSVRLGTAYFRRVMNMFEGNEELALAGYNGGPYRIKRLWSRAGPRRELDRFLENLTLEQSKTYVKRILIHQDSYRQLYPGLG
jgi:soluble lytic murein transglycosylase-like protein